MAAQITQAEIQELQKQFTQKIGDYAVKFDEISIYKGYSGQDANWSGAVLLEKDYSISWEFSLIDGLKITNANFIVNNRNKDIIKNIQDIYEVFYDKLNQVIRDVEVAPEEQETDDEVMLGTDADEIEQLGGPAETSPEGESMPISESRLIKNRRKNINSNYLRMNKLAGFNK
tara:strand:+ start:174 stop:692 length:519 start_codon:yes stop_codon:yes gene_type:complete